MIEPDPAVLYTTYSAFCAKVRRIAFPAGVGEKLKPAFDNFLMNALIKAQRYVECLRKIQVSFYGKNQMQENCGVSQIIGPRGKVNIVYAFKPGTQCVKHFYVPVTPHKIACWSQANLCRYENVPPGVGTSVWDDGSDVCEAYQLLYPGAEEDDTCWKCEDKFMARGNNGEIYLAPRPPCGYVVAVHWEGLKRKWLNTDAIVDDEDLIDWAAQYVQAEMALRHEREPQIGLANKGWAAEKFADLIYWCNQERMVQFHLDCVQGIDTGNLTWMFKPIYPYGDIYVGDGGGGDGGGSTPEEPGGSLPPLAGNEMLILESTDFSGQADQTPIDTWTDQSPFANDFSQAVSANQPWVDQFNKLNGNPTVRFQEFPSGTLRYLQRLLWDSTHQDAGYSFDAAEIIVIMKRDDDPPSDPDQQGSAFKFGNSSGNNSHVPLSTGDVYENFCQATRPNSGNPATAFTDWLVYQIKASKVNVTQCSRTIYVGSEVLENDPGSGVWAQPKPGSGLTIGASFQALLTVDQSMQGNIAAVYMFDALMSNSQRALWTAYIQDKWGLTIN